KITIVLEPSARDWLADKGYDPTYGARPLRRVIQKSVQDPLSELILSGGIKDGEREVISAGKQGLTFNGKLARAAVADDDGGPTRVRQGGGQLQGQAWSGGLSGR